MVTLSLITLTRVSISLLSLSLMSLSQMSLSPTSLCAMSLSLWCAHMAQQIRSKPVLELQRWCKGKSVSGFYLVSSLCCTHFHSGTDSGMCAGVLLFCVSIVDLFVSLVLISLCQALIITWIERFLDCTRLILYWFRVLWDIMHTIRGSPVTAIMILDNEYRMHRYLRYA